MNRRTCSSFAEHSLVWIAIGVATGLGVGCLDAPSSTFRPPMPAVHKWAAPQPRAYARFAYNLAVGGGHVAMTAPYELADEVAPTVDPANGDAMGGARGAAYVFDLQHPAAAARTFIAPNADPGDGQASIPLLRIAGSPLEAHLSSMSIAVEASWLAWGVAGEDSGLPPGDDPASAELDNSADDAGAVYIYALDALEAAQRDPQYVKAPRPQAGALFGESVAVSGSHLLVGAPADDGAEPDAASDSGAVYYYELQDGQFRFRQQIRAPAPSPSDLFGAAIALDGDVLVVGSPGDASAGVGVDPAPAERSVTLEGAVHVYRLRDGEWSHEHTLKPGIPLALGGFGSAVRIAGDYIAVGSAGASHCPDEPQGLQMRGVVYTFARQDEVWRNEQCLSPRSTGHIDLFGISVSLTADALLIGAGWDASGPLSPGSDQSQPFSGAAYLYRRGARGWSETAFIKAPHVATNAVFGASTELAQGRAVIGAVQQTEAGLRYGGAAYLFDISAGLQP